MNLDCCRSITHRNPDKKVESHLRIASLYHLNIWEERKKALRNLILLLNVSMFHKFWYNENARGSQIAVNLALAGTICCILHPIYQVSRDIEIIVRFEI